MNDFPDLLRYPQRAITLEAVPAPTPEDFAPGGPLREQLEAVSGRIRAVASLEADSAFSLRSVVVLSLVVQPVGGHEVMFDGKTGKPLGYWDGGEWHEMSGEIRRAPSDLVQEGRG